MDSVDVQSFEQPLQARALQPQSLGRSGMVALGADQRLEDPLACVGLYGRVIQQVRGRRAPQA
jgi:hypothetical protein